MYYLTIIISCFFGLACCQDTESRWRPSYGYHHAYNNPGYDFGFRPQSYGGGYNSGSGGSSYSNSVKLPGMTQQNSGNNYYSYANSLFGSFSSYSQSWSTSFSSRSKGADKTADLLQATASTFTNLGGKLGEACFLRVLCEVGVRPSRFHKFSELTIRFASAAEDHSVPDNLKVLVEAYHFGLRKSSSSCARKYLKCETSLEQLTSTVNAIKIKPF